MTPSGARLPTLAATLVALLACNPASAQFGTAFPGFVRLPDSDFTWIWGDIEEEDMSRNADFTARGSEASFRCDLRARLRPSSRRTQRDMRNLERDLNTSLIFIQDSATTLNILDQGFELDWGVLECHKPADEPGTEEEQQQRLDRALEKAIRDRERRRSREND